MPPNIIQSVALALRPIYSKEEAQAIAREIIERQFRRSLTSVYSGTAQPLSAEESARLHTAVDRLKTGEPVQYVLNEADFCGRTFYVDQRVLIPRPETEDLVKEALHAVLTMQQPTVVDACTGSGCIAITTGLERTDAKVTGVDIDRDALAVAQINSRKLGSKVRWMECDLLAPCPLPRGSVDVLVSNPPYVPNNRRKHLDLGVRRYEPPRALYVPDDDPLLFYRALSAWGRHLLCKDGYLIVEIDSPQASAVAHLFSTAGYREVTIKKDLFNNDRYVICHR